MFSPFSSGFSTPEDTHTHTHTQTHTHTHTHKHLHSCVTHAHTIGTREDDSRRSARSERAESVDVFRVEEGGIVEQAVRVKGRYGLVDVEVDAALRPRMDGGVEQKVAGQRRVQTVPRRRRNGRRTAAGGGGQGRRKAAVETVVPPVGRAQSDAVYGQIERVAADAAQVVVAEAAESTGNDRITVGARPYQLVELRVAVRRRRRRTEGGDGQRWVGDAVVDGRTAAATADDDGGVDDVVGLDAADAADVDMAVELRRPAHVERVRQRVGAEVEDRVGDDVTADAGRRSAVADVRRRPVVGVVAAAEPLGGAEVAENTAGSSALLEDVTVDEILKFWVDRPEAALSRFVFTARHLPETLVER